MAEESRIFHESWYRIANQRISLSAGVRVRRQLFRGARWHVLSDPFTGQFYRLRPGAYDFVARLSPRRTVEEVWRESMERDPENTPGQEDVIQLLAQLYHANLLRYELAPDSEKLFERYKERKQKITQTTLLNVMFMRIPLLDPDVFLKRLLPFVRILMGPLGLILWVAAVSWGIAAVAGNFAAIGTQTQGVLAPSNLPLLYLGLVLIKTLHEFGHAFAVRRFGGEVHIMGIMFLIFSPLPYVDATSAWAFRAKAKRVLVGAAGMIVELFVAACAAIVWANTGQGTLHSLAYNMIFVASVSTIVFNINPLLRYDGYYILSDLFDIPNLHTQATTHLRHLVERYAFGDRKSRSPAASRKEAFWLTVFGILSGIYRFVVFGGILIVMADRFLIIGIIMAVVSAISWVIVPVGRLIRYLATDPKLEHRRLRAVLACGGAAAAVIGFLALCPFPNSFKSPGVVKAKQYEIVVSHVGGDIREVIAPSGARVHAHQALLQMEDPELDYRIQELEGKLVEVDAVRQRALQEKLADVQSVDSVAQSITKQLTKLEDDRRALLVTAPLDGVWVAPDVAHLVGAWLPRGAPVGQVVDDASFIFSSVVSQRNASRVFSGEVKKADVRLAGRANQTIATTGSVQIPMEQTSLPSAALGIGAGGEVRINLSDSTGLKASEPFYEVRLELSPGNSPSLFHGQSGQVRFQLSPEPLLRQWIRLLRQLIQERYQL
jgi:putative peptide zinc metalloprotease protein